MWDVRAAVKYCIGWCLGEHMVNRIPNGSLLTNKLGLLNSLQEYAKVCKLIYYVYLLPGCSVFDGIVV